MRRSGLFATLNADVYVFAVVREPSHDRYNALDVENWGFSIVPVRKRAALNQQRMSLALVGRLAGAPVPYNQLAEEIELVGASTSSTRPAHVKTNFALPYLREYLRDNAAHDD